MQWQVIEVLSGGAKHQRVLQAPEEEEEVRGLAVVWLSQFGSSHYLLKTRCDRECSVQVEVIWAVWQNNQYKITAHTQKLHTRKQVHYVESK